MVKNKFGGNKHKGFARKFVNAKPDNRLRLSEDDCELYGIAIKMLGNNMFHCLCIDGITRLAHIRGKFAGRGKRDNMINVGTWVLIGIREWDNKTNEEKKTTSTKLKLQQCDLLEVYTEFDIERLKDSVDANWTILVVTDGTDNIKSSKIDDSIYFATEKDIERDKLLDEINTNKTSKIKLNITNNDEEVDIDTI
jgi:translation initiation factor 1A